MAVKKTTTSKASTAAKKSAASAKAAPTKAAPTKTKTTAKTAAAKKATMAKTAEVSIPAAANKAAATRKTTAAQTTAAKTTTKKSTTSKKTTSTKTTSTKTTPKTPAKTPAKPATAKKPVAARASTAPTKPVAPVKPVVARQPALPAVEEILQIGIDLGTSRSVVCASNEQREWIESYVGWPKDFIARRTLGNRVLFGAEALEHRLSLDLLRPLANGVIREGTEREEEAVRELIGYLISLAAPEPEQQLYVAVGIPAEALKVNRTSIVNAVSEHAHKLIIVSEPFAVAYSLAALDNAMVIDIGAGTVDFCIMHGAMPAEEDQRSLMTAGDYVDQQLYDLLAEHHPNSDFTLNMARKFKEEYGFVGDAREKVEIEAPVQGKMMTHDITDDLRRACESIMPPIVETIMDMIAKFDPEYQAKIRGNIILAGGGSQIAGIENYLEAATQDFEPCNFTCVEDPLYVGADGALGLAQDAPDEYWEK